MSNSYAVRTLVFSSGERFPILVNRAIGEPLFEPTIYSLTELRAANKASNTIEQSLRSILVFLVFLDLRRIDLDARMRQGKVLQLGEIDDLVRLCGLPVERLLTLRSERTEDKPVRIASIEKFRMHRQAAAQPKVSSASSANRIRVISKYLDWLVLERLSRQDIEGGLYTALMSAGERTKSALTARVSSTGGRNTIGQREGPGPDVMARLYEVIAQESPDNPWIGDHAKKRNELAIRWLFELGLRRGELLNIKVDPDINFTREVVTIARRADDPADPRRNQPKVKTRDRKLPLSRELSTMTHDYVTKVRHKLNGARKHAFLFVADKTGKPLSMSALNKTFVVLRKKCPGLPDNFSPHVGRHHCNDAFSETVDKQGISEADEIKLRSYQMGWSETSGTAAIYTRRHTREKAQKVSLKTQADQAKGMKSDE